VKGLDLPLFDASFAFEPTGALKRVLLAEGGARVDIVPTGQNYRVMLTASGWRPPIGPRLSFDELALDADVENGILNSRRIEGRIAGGSLVASMKASWRNGVRVEGEFDLAESLLHRLLPAYTGDFKANGTLMAHGQYSLQGTEFGELLKQARVDANFLITRGELHNFDLVHALQSPPLSGMRGGRTRFDKLAGTLQVRGKQYSYKNLRLVSGPMNANGSFEIGPAQQLAGRMTAEIGSQSGFVRRAALSITGRVSDPVLKR
jgi:hypothetical protein